MTDSKKSEVFEDVDWSEALAEWEEKSFAPEVARDVVTDKPAALAGGSPATPLYRPPSARAPSSPPFSNVTFEDDEDDDGGATLIAAIPEELLRRGGDDPPPTATPEKVAELDVVARAHEEKRGARGSTSDPPDVVTSAKSVPATSSAPPMEALRRPSVAETPEATPDGALFDPFVDERAPATESSPKSSPGGRARSVAPTPNESRARSVAPTPNESRARSIAPTPHEGQPSRSLPPAFRESEPGRSIPPASRESEPGRSLPPATSENRSVRSIAPAAENRSATSIAPLEATSDRGPSMPPDEAKTSPHASRRVASLASSQPPRPAPFEPPHSWPGEKPAEAWLDENGRSAFGDRAKWLEEEARALTDRTARARGLLACSELLAMTGHRERAHTLAAEARDLAPSLALAHRQARQLLPWPPDPDEYLESLDREAKTASTAPVRLHATLLAIEALRARGDHQGASKRLELAARLPSPAGVDVRAPLLRAARALALGELTSPALRIADSNDLSPLARAVATCLRLRGANAPKDERSAHQSDDALLRARRTLAKGDLAGAATAIADLVQNPELAPGAQWLASALAAPAGASRPLSMTMLQELIAGGDEAAPAALVARALEMGDKAVVTAAASSDGPLSAADRVAFAALAGVPVTAQDPRMEATATAAGMRPLACAACAILAVGVPGRSGRTAGSERSAIEATLGRELASRAADAVVEGALSAVQGSTPSARAIGVELSVRAGRFDDISHAIETWGASREPAVVAPLAAALVAEQAGSKSRSEEAFQRAHRIDPGCEVALRALVSLEPADQVPQLNAIADEWGDGQRSALARIEAIARGGTSLPDPTQMHLLELAHRAAPSLPIASFLAERIARRNGDVDEVLKWIRERAGGDRTEQAIDSIREALLVADRDPETAGEKLREAHVLRPGDVALRDLYERMATEPPDDVATWREQRAAEMTGDSRILLSLEAAYEFERLGDDDGALRCATAAASGGQSVARAACERAELRSGRVSRLADELLAAAKNGPTDENRREAYERLAILDAEGRHDAGSALLWHRSVLELFPEHLPSLRHVEQHLVGEGRVDELEPVAASIARALREPSPGEGTAHAELAARLRLRSGSSDVAPALEMVEISAAGDGASLWALRSLHALALLRNDDAKALDALRRILEREARSSDVAFLLVRAAEIALRLDRRDEARSLLERATVEDPADVVSWTLLASVRRNAGDARGAAEATEALARCSGVPERRLVAWYDAGCLWMDEVHDRDRAISALEAAASLDSSNADVFERLSRAYADRKMLPELAEVLRRQMESTADPERRLAIEVRRGRVLLDVGEVAGARQAFQSALEERPDDPGALSAFADLCTKDGDWEAAEQALVRLARLLPTAEEQRRVYSRLGDLYSNHLVNLTRAEVALKEVLKRAPGDVETTRKLVEIHTRQNDPVRAVELQQELVSRTASQAEKSVRILELASLHEHAARDVRRAEKTLEGARREAPNDTMLLRALAELYVRHRQTPAFNILLDRAAADARRTLASGRIVPEAFRIVSTVFELRDRPDAAAAVEALTAAAIDGEATQLGGAGSRAFDSECDGALAPDLLTAGIRSLLARTGDALEAVAPVDMGELRAVPLPSDSPVARLVQRTISAAGLPSVQLLSSPAVRSGCLAVGSAPAIVLAGSLANDEAVGGFLALRALAQIRVKTSALVRSAPADLAVTVSAWLKRFNPSWQPSGVPASALDAAYARAQAAMPRAPDPEISVLALEAAAAIDGRQASLGAAATAWSNRVALLALGDLRGALDAIALAQGHGSRVPTDPRERAAWISRTAEARDLLVFGVGDAFAQTRSRLGLKA